uniref:Uncharacterized protein n=1 Tax=Myoviridae sp. ct2Qy24 TaxID=2827656 RepID=A0A8S5SSB4_9CAUD|nr:MAG TPA: hypothetical protein [Myoviridae sp. ct2Qy24]
MAYIKFRNSKDFVKCLIEPKENIVSLAFPLGDAVSTNTSGFDAYLDAKGELLIGEYGAYTTVYRNCPEKNGYELSNDGSVYMEPEKIISFRAEVGGSLDGETDQVVQDYANLTTPEPKPEQNYVFVGWVPEIPESGAVKESTVYHATFEYVPTLEEVQEAKVTEMNTLQQSIIASGLDVTLSDGTTEHFTLTGQDQTSLMGLQTQVAAGAENIPWHTSDEKEHCKFYSNADMLLIVTAAMEFVTWHVTYFRDLRIYIRSIEDKVAVAAIQYGTDIPEQYQSAPLKAMLAAQNT